MALGRSGSDPCRVTVSARSSLFLTAMPAGLKFRGAEFEYDSHTLTKGVLMTSTASPLLRLTAVLAVAWVAVACGQDSLGPVDPGPQFDLVDPGHLVKVCKVGSPGTYSFTISATGGSLPLGNEFTVDAGSCVSPWVATGNEWVELTVNEVDATGLELVEVSAETSFVTTDSEVTFQVSDYWGARVVYYNTVGIAEGRMTGGGFQIRVGQVKVTGGLTLHCDNTLSNNLQVNWPGGNRWHLEKESLDNILCIDDPAYTEQPPEAPFNTFIATATGSLNGVDGSVINFRFIDDGEPGRYHDLVELQISAPGDPGTIVLDVPLRVIDLGNLQAHFDQPHS